MITCYVRRLINRFFNSSSSVKHFVQISINSIIWNDIWSIFCRYGKSHPSIKIYHFHTMSTSSRTHDYFILIRTFRIDNFTMICRFEESIFRAWFREKVDGRICIFVSESRFNSSTSCVGFDVSVLQAWARIHESKLIFLPSDEDTGTTDW